MNVLTFTPMDTAAATETPTPTPLASLPPLGSATPLASLRGRKIREFARSRPPGEVHRSRPQNKCNFGEGVNLRNGDNIRER